MKPTEGDERLWQSVAGLIEYGREAISTMHVVEIDELPAADERGRRRVDGWKVSWEGRVLPDWLNLVGGLHGAASAWIVDTCTSAALIAVHTETFWGQPMPAGVSLSIDMQYFHMAPSAMYLPHTLIGLRDTKLRITVEILRLTETLANLRCDITDFDTGKLYASGSHLKAWRGGKRVQAKL